MDDVPAPEATQPTAARATTRRPTTERPGDAAGPDRTLAWPSPPPQTVEHAVALLAATWTRAEGAA